MLKIFSHQRGLEDEQQQDSSVSSLVSAATATASTTGTTAKTFLPSDDLDELLADSEHFIQELRASLPSDNQGFSPFKYIMSRFNTSSSASNGNGTHRNEKLETVYKSLLPKIDDVELVLRGKVCELVLKKQALQEQGRFLKTRLDACIIYNGDVVQSRDVFISHVRDFVSRLSAECNVLKNVVLFNIELIRQQLIQVAQTHLLAFTLNTPRLNVRT